MKSVPLQIDQTINSRQLGNLRVYFQRKKIITFLVGMRNPGGDELKEDVRLGSASLLDRKLKLTTSAK